MPDDAQQLIESYLGRLSRRLRTLNDEAAHEIIEELRSHILDRAGGSGPLTAGGVRNALTALGTPEELASQYLTNELLARAEVSRSPLRVLETLFRWAAFSMAGFVVLIASLSGYFLGAVLVIAALSKPFHPQAAGLWLLDKGTDNLAISLRLGFGTPPTDGREVLGWWIVPLGLGAGCASIILTTAFALWCGRRYRESRHLPGAH